MAGPSSDAALKRKLADVDVDANWDGHDLEQALQEKRALEEAEEYNTPDVRQRAKQIGIQEARTSVSDVSKMYAKDLDRHSSPLTTCPALTRAQLQQRYSSRPFHLRRQFFRVCQRRRDRHSIENRRGSRRRSSKRSRGC